MYEEAVTHFVEKAHQNKTTWHSEPAIQTENKIEFRFPKKS